MIQVFTYTGRKLLPLYPAGDVPPRDAIKLVAGTYKAGQVVELTATPGTYQATTLDANALLMLEYDVVVDGTGRHFHGAQASDETGMGDAHTSAYAPGGGLSFDTRDLAKDNAGTAITAAIVTALGAKVISGTAAAGVIQF